MRVSCPIAGARASQERVGECGETRDRFDRGAEVEGGAGSLGAGDDVAHVGGLGLGLSIVEDCVGAMHGRIEVKSDVGVGTTFVLTLPRTPPESLKS